jgi:hypothetical protein
VPTLGTLIWAEPRAAETAATAATPSGVAPGAAAVGACLANPACALFIADVLFASGVTAILAPQALEALDKLLGTSMMTRAGDDNAPRSTLPRDSAGNYKPDPAAQGAHTTLGERTGSQGAYGQGATFDSNGRFQGRTDVTNHGRADHPSPHFHPATGPNSVGPPEPLGP